MDDLLLEFVAETREMLEAMQGELVVWEAEPTDRDRLDTIFRFVHTVKGNCGFFDLPRIESLCHAAESALADVRSGQRLPDGLFVNAILAIIDRTVAMVDAIDAGEDFPEGGDEELIQMLNLNIENSDGLTDPATSKQPGVQINDKTKSVLRPARSIRLPVPLLDRIMAGVSDVVLVRNELARCISDADAHSIMGATFERLSGIVDNLRENISHMRMQRLDHLFVTLPRLVRDISAELGKQATIDVEGGEVELDREMIELLRDPLMHILRNAIDHGIEKPSERLATGKSEFGLINISARQTGNSIAISITDDGRGIDTEALVKKAIAAGISTEEECAQMSRKEHIALIFQPGISTSEKVTSVSGRGVGMDVVRSNIEGFGGEIRVTSKAGEGTRQTLLLPATLSTALTVRVDNQNFGIPRSYVEEIVSMTSESLEFDRAGDTPLVKFRGERLRYAPLSETLDIDTSYNVQSGALLMIRLNSGDLFGLAVEKVVDHQELVIKPLAPVIAATDFYTGTSLLDDGGLVLMLDMAGIARREGLISDVNKHNRTSALEKRHKSEETPGVPALLIVGLDGKHRIVRMEPVSRIEKVDSEAIRTSDDTNQVVIDEKIYPLAGIAYGKPSEGKIAILRLSDGVCELAYAIQRVVDTVDITNAVVPEKIKGEIEGVTLFDGEAVEVLDCHWLFTRHSGHEYQPITKTCRIDKEDPWVRSILLPLVEAAGYKTIGRDTDKAADIEIAMSTREPMHEHAGQVITLTNDPSEADHKEDVIYRYDRPALLASLSSKQRKFS